MIEANITTYIGQDNDAVHYYCHYDEVDYEIPRKYGHVGYGCEELFRTVTDPIEVIRLNNKDRAHGMHVGSETNRFNTFEEINDELLKKFPNKNIVTYEDNQPFKDMLYFIDGVNLGYKGLGELFVNIPASCWKDLLPPEDEIIIKCENCGTIHEFENIVIDEYYHEIEKRTFIKFTTRGYEMNNRCCKYPQLIWNVIL